MGKAMIRNHVLRLFAEIYEEWKRKFPFDSEEGSEVMVPLKDLRMAYEIISENDELQIGKKEK